MKKLFVISIFMSFIQIYGQNVIDSDRVEIEPESISFSLISDSCKEIKDWDNKKDCSREEIQKKVSKKIFRLYNSSTKKSQKGNYIISYNFTIDENGILSDIDITTDNNELKPELKNILESIISDFRLIDENGKVLKKRFSFSIPFKIYASE